MEQINETVVAEESVVVTKRGRKPKEETEEVEAETVSGERAPHVGAAADVSDF